MSMGNAFAGQQRQRHGVAKNIAEGVGGVVVGAALVVLARHLLRRRDQQRAAPHALEKPAADPAAAEHS
jgi:ABC-type uncharacterized transport system permease subunit